MRRPPAFWSAARPTFAARLLSPAGAIYGAVAARRMGRTGVDLPVPVLCIGNFVVGGAGKTPVAIALVPLLRRLGHTPAILSRGYGRVVGAAAVIRVNPDWHSAREVGDEPLLLARVAPTYVARDRVAAGRAAVAAGASIVILDDGLQSPGLRKTASIAVVDGDSGVGNGLCLPAGPLRAPLDAQWPKTSAVCLIGTGQAAQDIRGLAQARGKSVFGAHLQPDADDVVRLRGRPLVAFAGIGRPEKFFSTLRVQGLDLRETRAFPDHQRFSERDMAKLDAVAKTHFAILVTTAKDRTRLPHALATEVLRVELSFDNEKAVVAWLAETLSPAAPV